MTREEMMDKVIRTRGFEDKWTIWFCEIAESDASISTVSMAMILALLQKEEMEEL